MTNEPKTALITGSYSGLGAALAAEHAIRGGDVILSDLNGDRLQEQQKEIAVKYRVHAHTLPADLTKPEEVEQIYNECREHHMHVDYLICNAGFGGQGAFAERSMEKDMAMIAVNIEATTRLLKLFLPDMVKRGAGKVLIISSISAKMPGPLQAVYFSSKAYLTSLGDALWRELRGDGRHGDHRDAGNSGDGLCGKRTLGGYAAVLAARRPDRRRGESV